MDCPRLNLSMDDIASHLPLLGDLEVRLPPEQPYMERFPPYFVNKELPPIPKLAPEPDLSTPPIPPYNPLRFTRTLQNGFLRGDTATSPPFGSTSSEDSLPEVPPLSRSRHPQPPKTLRLLGQPTLTVKTPISPTYGQTDKVRQLTGYDLASPDNRRHHRKSSKDSASTTSSCYSDPEIHILSDNEGVNGPGGYTGLRYSVDIDRYQGHKKTHSLSSPVKQRRVSKRYSKAVVDDLLQRQCARFQHDALFPISSRVHSPSYSAAQSLYSVPRTPPLPDAPHAGEFTLPLRIRPSQSIEEPASRFSDISTPPASPTTRFSAGIRDSVQSIAAHAPFGRTRPLSRLLERRDKNTGEELFDEEGSSGEDTAILGALQRLVGRKRDAACEAGIEGSGKRSRNGGLMRKISNAMFPKWPTNIPKSDERRVSGLGIVIPDHRRQIGGPDTPMPGIESGRGWVENVLSKEASMRRRQSIRGAIGRATESRWVVGGEDRREKRRERLKGQIKVIGLKEVQEDEEMAELRRW